MRSAISLPGGQAKRLSLPAAWAVRENRPSMSARASPCPGCRLLLPEREGPTHPYLGSSPACWDLYGEVLAREYSEPAYFGVHQLTVDTYAVQHPGVAERRSIQSVALHLITLSLMLERRADRGAGPVLHKRLAKRGGFHWLEPPERNGQITVADVHQAANATEHLHRVEVWARDVWEAWAAHHSTVRRWVEDGLADGSGCPPT
jgi:hypothetical protein